MTSQVILVLGGTGFVGNHLCARLIAGGEAFAKTFDYRTVYQPYLDLISKWGGRSL